MKEERWVNIDQINLPLIPLRKQRLHHQQVITPDKPVRLAVSFWRFFSLRNCSRSSWTVNSGSGSVYSDDIFIRTCLKVIRICDYSQEHNIFDIYPEHFASFAVHDFNHRKEREVRKDSLNCLVIDYNKFPILFITKKLTP
jgi:hypothetical protein